MKARIVRDNCGYYTGEICINTSNNTKWKQVTHSCITKIGAKRELTKWKQKNYPDEFEI